MRKVFYVAVSLFISLSCVVFAGEGERRDGQSESPQAQPAGKTSEINKSPQDKKGERSIIVARVNGVAITQRSVVDMMNHLSSLKMSFPQTPQEKEALRKEALDRLIVEELAYQKAKAEGFKAEAGDVDKRVANLKEKLGSEEAFIKKLETQQMTEKELRADIERSIVLQGIFQREVFSKVSVTEEDIEREYEKEKGTFVVPEKIIVTDVVFFLYPEDPESVKKAEKVLDKIRSEKNNDPQDLVPDGSFIVYDTEIKKDSQKELYEKARELKVGELSGVVITPDSLHIMKMREYFPAKQLTLQEVRGYVEGKLTTEARRKRLREWDGELRKGAHIEIIGTKQGTD